MDTSQAINVAVQVTAILVLVAMIVVLTRSIAIGRNLSGRPGEKLVQIITGVVLGFAIAQGLAVLNVFGIIAFDGDWLGGSHNFVRLLQQIAIAITCFWAWRKLSNLL